MDASFQQALLRARQLAAKIAPANARNGGGGGGLTPDNNSNDDSNDASSMKRSHDEEGFDSQAKRLNIGAKLAEMKNSSFQKPQRDQLYLGGVVFKGEKTLDIMLPGNKVGIIIGKGGETIRNLQERAGVKMLIIQESKTASDQQKQLRIIGPPEKVDKAEQLVKEMLVEKEIDNGKFRNAGPRMGAFGGGPGGPGNGGGGLSEYGSSSRITYQEMAISPSLIGLVIGKSGENIRRIQGETMCKVQFDAHKTDNQGNKICQFTGSQDCVKQAMDMVEDIIATANGGVKGNAEEIRILVPASKTGSVIGRGGETIRAFKLQSQCNIELDKNFQSDNDERCFIIRGPADKIGYAQQLVSDKVGGHVTEISNSMASKSVFGNDNPYNYLANQAYGGGGHPSQYYWQGQGAAPAGSNESGENKSDAQDQYSAWAAYYAQCEQYAQAQGQQTSAATAAAADSAAAFNRLPKSSEEVGVYQQWIQYYHMMNMPDQAKMLEGKLAEYAKQQSQNDHHADRNGRGD